jgi:hypothetical protein
MGIFYLSGLGKSPGAGSIPLQYIYLITKAAEMDDKDALVFLRNSGEIEEKKVEYPEYAIFFTSKEIIEGEEKPYNNLIDEWFRIPANTIDSIPRIIGKSINNLINACNFRDGKNAYLKEIFLIKVKHKDFSDAYRKIYTTIKALSRKEIWISYLGGTNQINLALFLSSSLTGHPTKYIYVAQENERKIHPDIKTPDFQNPKISIPPKDWYDLPFLWLGVENKILQEIENIFQWRNNGVNKKEIESILKKNNLSNQFLAKFQSADLIQIKKNNKVIKGKGFDELKNYMPDTVPNNMAEWI